LDRRSGSLPQFGGERAAQFFGRFRILKHQGTLQITRAVKTARKTKVALQISPMRTEQRYDGLPLRRHKRLLYH
jgi:hypothetical protein